MFLNRLKIDVKYSHTSIYDFFRKHYSLKESRKFSYIKKCLVYIEGGYDFPIAFSKAVEEEKLFTEDEKSKLISLGTSLGTSCVETQVNLIGYYIELFERKYEESRCINNKNSKAALMICTFIGAGIYIISV